MSKSRKKGQRGQSAAPKKPSPPTPTPTAPRDAASPPEAAAEPPSWWRKILAEPLALALVPLVFLRPFLDGITWPTDNLYFLWGVAIVVAVWAVGAIRRNRPVRHGIPIGIIACFLGVGLLTASGTVQVDATYRSLLLWTGHVLLFIVVTNVVTTRTALGIALTAFVATAFGETLWSLIHLKYVLPFVRESVNSNPEQFLLYFRTPVPSPELIHRLEVNRAFGTLLFPNALAAFLIIGIPYVCAEGVRSVWGLKEALGAARSGEGPAASPRLRVIAPLGTWLGALLVSYFLFTFSASFDYPLPAGITRLGPFVHGPDMGYRLASGGFCVRWFFFMVALPLASGILVGYPLMRYGRAASWYMVRVAVLWPLLLMQVVALWKTYSRGGMIALAGALVWIGIITFWSRKQGGHLRKAGARAAMVALTIALAAVIFAVPSASGQGPSGPTNDAAAQTAAAPPPQATPAQGSPHSAIKTEGKDLTLGELASPASFRLRLTYWQTGIYMALDNVLTGVGMGNFGTVYPRYQRPGAGDVQTAHNDYLQALCETGLLGFAAFCGFWLYFILAGARRIIAEKKTSQRWLLAGLYTSVVAFLIHSLVDFNFYNPSLAFFAFLMAGLFFSASSEEKAGAEAGATASKTQGRDRITVGLMLAAAAVVTGMAVPVYLSDFIVGGRRFVSVGNHKRINALYDTGEFFMTRLRKVPQGQRKPMRDILSVAALIPDRKTIELFGTILVPTGSAAGSYRPLRPDEAVSEEAIVRFDKPFEARGQMRRYAGLLLEELGHADAIYPHNPDMAAYFIQWYDLLSRTTVTPEDRQRYAAEFVNWTKEAVKRSPWQSVFHEMCGKALLLRGSLEDKGGNARQYYEEGLAEYRKAADLYPSSARVWETYGRNAVKYGEALTKSGDTAVGAQYIEQGQEALERVAALQGS